jgi:hypothetical protein
MAEETAVRTRLALDQNFPEPILNAVAEFVVDIELVPLRRIDAAMPDLADRDLMIALRQEGFDWLVTNNYRMLRNPFELASIIRSEMNVFAIQGTGHDPLRAAGALLLDLAGAIRRAGTSHGVVFWSRPRNPDPQRPWDLFATAARHQHQEPTALYDELKVTPEEFAEPWRQKLPDPA